VAKAIPRKIRKYPGLVKAWKARVGLYDPKPRKRRRRMATGYGTVNKKPFRRGARGGVAWSGGRKPRYDPKRRNYRHKAKKGLNKVISGAEKYASWIGVLVGLLLPAEICRKRHGYDLKGHYIDGTIHEIKALFGGGVWSNSVQYLTFKFTSPNSAWTTPFWGSIGVWIGTKILHSVNPFGGKAGRLIKIINKVSLGTLAAAIIGGLFLLGGTGEPSTSNPTRNQPAQTLNSYYG